MISPTLQRIIRKRDLPDYTGLQRSAIEALIAHGDFPKPIQLGQRAVGWVEAELIAWQMKRMAERDSDA
jgi:prophage regulatory protein